MIALASLLALLSAQSPDLEFFEKKVRPVFASKCESCHGAKVKMAGLSFTSPESLAGFVTKNDPAHSRIYQAVLYTEKTRMPPAGKLSDLEIDAIRQWIESGAVWPSSPSAPSPSKRQITAADRSHWAFQPVKAYQPPAVANAAWPANEIDRFLLAKLEEKGIRPAPPAGKLTLLRRVTYDLTGLPPTLDQIRDFLADNSPSAYRNLVDRLLASPHYGERWGRHWLDVARFADSTGMDEDHMYPHAWRYRDYVIRAFNNDKPFDQFVREQIAGDLLPNGDGVVATGFLALGPKPLAQQDRVQMIYDVVDEQIDSTSKAFLGLTLSCARCHDHKFDPLLTKDYYALAGIFASTSSFRNLGRPGSVSYIEYVPVDRAAFDRYQAHRWRLLGKQLELEDAIAENVTRENNLHRPKLAENLAAAWKGLRGAPGADPKWLKWLQSADEKARSTYLQKLFQATDATIDAVARDYAERYMASATRWDRSLDNWRRRFATDALQERDLQPRPKFAAEDDPFFAALTFNGPMEVPDMGRVIRLRAEFEDLQRTLPPEPEMVSGVGEGSIIQQHVFVRGSHHSPGDPAPKQMPIVLAGDSQNPVTRGSGRLELANFLASPHNPLTARVFVNRVWQWHFGEALVRTPNNWGRTGEKPTHPELLDFLTARFIASGWSVKALHRLILDSSAYRMSAAVSQEARDRDPSNRLWSRFPRTRMSVEQIRDSLLAIDGSLDPTVGGPLPVKSKEKRPRVDPDEVKRRTLYLPVRRGSIPTVLSTFDYGDATTVSEGRSRTNVAPQALFMLNGRFVIDRSKGLAEKLLAATSDPDRVRNAYLAVLTREPSPAEIDDALSYVDSLRKRIPAPAAPSLVWQSLCHVLMASNEFLYLE